MVPDWIASVIQIHSHECVKPQMAWIIWILLLLVLLALRGKARNVAWSGAEGNGTACGLKPCTPAGSSTNSGIDRSLASCRNNGVRNARPSCHYDVFGSGFAAVWTG